MWRVRTLAALGAVAVAGGAAVASADSADDLTLPPRHTTGPNTKIAIDALNDAMQSVMKRDHGCRFRPPRREHAVTHDPPTPELLAALGVLRRPAIPADAAQPKHLLPVFGTAQVDYVRRARVLDDGTSVWIIPVLSPRYVPGTRPARCRVLEREALAHRLRGKPAQAQREARRVLARSQRFERKRPPTAPAQSFFVFETRGTGGGGGGGGGGGVAFLRKQGSVISSGGGKAHGTRIIGVVPDGVATIDFAFAKGRSIETYPPGVRAPERTYATVYRKTVKVVSNVYALRVPRRSMDASYHREVWRDADGSAINVVKPPRA